MTYGKSNGHVTNDVTWSRKSWPKYVYSPMSQKQKQLEMLFSNNR